MRFRYSVSQKVRYCIKEIFFIALRSTLLDNNACTEMGEFSRCQRMTILVIVIGQRKGIKILDKLDFLWHDEWCAIRPGQHFVCGLVVVETFLCGIHLERSAQGDRSGRQVHAILFQVLYHAGKRLFHSRVSLNRRRYGFLRLSLS